MEAPAISNTLWPLLTLAVVALWTAAMADITRHRLRGGLTRAGSVGMVAAVSVVAVIALAGIGAVFDGQRLERANPGANKPAETGVDVPGHAYLFSFGLEHASDVTPKSAKQPG